MCNGLKTALKNGWVAKGLMGYYYLILKGNKKEDIVKATVWLMEATAAGELLMVGDRFGQPIWNDRV